MHDANRKVDLPMDVEASLDLSIGQKCPAEYRAIKRRRRLAVHPPTALGGHAWLIEAPSSASSSPALITISFSLLFIGY
jgi:hypothetical protein